MRVLIKTLVYFYFFTLMVFSIGVLLKCVTENKADLQCPYLRREITEIARLISVDKYFTNFFSYLNFFDKTILNLLAFNGYISTVALLITCLYSIICWLHKGLGTALQFALLIIFVSMLIGIAQRTTIDSDLGVTFMGTAKDMLETGKRLVNLIIG